MGLMMLSYISTAQLTVDNGVSAADAVQNTLLGTGIDVSNVIFSGDGNQVGTFDGVNSNLGLGSGVIIGSGDVINAQGPNNIGSSSTGGGNFGAGDPDLAILNPGFTLNDAAVLEFDFVATGDSMMFNYVWASEEYPEYVNSTFNDVFGLFLSGPGINGPYSNNAENIAIIPGTTSAVTIDNVNNGTDGTGGPCVNCEYYIHNGNGSNSPQNTDSWYIQYDGFTTVLSAQAIVQCGETYHIKIAVADAGDTGFDSAVFLEAGSFVSNQVTLDLTIPNISVDDSTMYEGCGVANLIFSRSNGNPGPQTLLLELSGSAENGVDYSFIPDSITFEAGVYELIIPLEIYEDFNLEGLENLILEITNEQTCGLSSLGYLEVFIADVEALNADYLSPTINCDEATILTIEPFGGFGLYDIEWGDGTPGPNLEVSPGETTSYYFTISDTCSIATFTDSITVTIPDYPPITINLGSDQELDCQSMLSIDPIVEGGYGDYSYQWEILDTTLTTEGPISVFVDSEGVVLLTITDQCGSSEEASMNFEFPLVEVEVDLGEDFDVLCTDISTIESTVEGGIGDYTYSWESDGEEIGTDAWLDIQLTEETTLTLTVFDECDNSSSDDITISVPEVAISVDLGEDMDVLCTDLNTLEANVDGGVGDYSYSWQNGNDVLGSNTTLDILTIDDILINLIITDECGNISNDEIQILVPALTVYVDLGGDLNVNCIETSTLSGEVSGGVSPYTLSWQIEGVEQGNEDNFDLIAGDETTVTLVAIDQCGNEGEDELTLFVPPVPLNVVFPNDLVVNCMDTSLLFADVSGGIGGYSYSWTQNGQLIGQDDTNVFITSETTSVLLSVEDECGNIGTGQINLSVIPEPIVIVLPDDTAVCIGNDFSFTAQVSGGNGSYSYSWNSGTSNSPTISETPQESTIYTLTVNDQCGNVADEYVIVYVEEVYADFDFDYLGNWGLQMYNTSINAVGYYWDFGDQEFSYMTNPSHSYYDNDEHQITLYAEGELGCIDSITHWFIPMMDVFVPSSFTPNDDGINDVFRIQGHDIYTFEFWVFNRWGEVLFYSQDIDEVWDGSVNSGTHYVQDGVYQYLVKAVGIRENSIEQVGTITVYR